MSRRKRRRHVKAVASRPLPSRENPGAASLLGDVADALNACHRAGIAVKLAHGALITEQGYVFPVGPGTAPWAVRTRALTPFPVAGEGDD